MEGMKPQAKRSSNVIDLRQQAANSAAPAAPAPVRRPAPAPAAPQRAAKPVPARQVTRQAAPVARPTRQVAPVAAGPVSPAADQAVPQRRFWPAFWRFLVLLIVLGVVVVVGVYIYLSYISG